MNRKTKSNLVFYSAIIIIAVSYFYKYKVAPDILLSEISFTKDAQVINVDEYIGGNVLVCFYSSSCGPCMKELPILNELHAELRDNGIELLVFTNDEVSKIQEVSKRFQLNFEVLSLTDNMTDYGIHSIPTHFVFNIDGELMYKKTGPLPWRSNQVIDELNKLLK